MSADNGIYIHKFSDGWRVVETQAIDNIYWEADGSGYNSRELWDYFKKSPLFQTKAEALTYASELYDEIMEDDFPILEYGISFV